MDICDLFQVWKGMNFVLFPYCQPVTFSLSATAFGAPFWPNDRMQVPDEWDINDIRGFITLETMSVSFGAFTQLELILTLLQYYFPKMYRVLFTQQIT